MTWLILLCSALVFFQHGHSFYWLLPWKKYIRVESTRAMHSIQLCVFVQSSTFNFLPSYLRKSYEISLAHNLMHNAFWSWKILLHCTDIIFISLCWNKKRKQAKVRKIRRVWASSQAQANILYSSGAPGMMKFRKLGFYDDSLADIIVMCVLIIVVVFVSQQCIVSYLDF